jgi:adenosylcobinamide-phosphate synthase
MLEFSPLAAAAGGTPLVVLVAVLLLDLVLGYVPQMGHLHPPLPGVRGWLEGLERRLNRQNRSLANLMIRGAVVTVVVLAAAAVLGWGLWRLALILPFGIAAEVVVLFAVISQSRVIGAMSEARDAILDGSHGAARNAINTLVPGNYQGRDDYTIARALIEQGARGFLTRYIGPAFWYCLGGLPGVFVYMASLYLRTAFAPRKDRGDAFGLAARGVSDALDYLPARLAGLFLILAGLFLPHGTPKEGFAVLRRDGKRYPGVNGRWIIAPMAGVLGLALIGPRPVGGPPALGDGWIGDGRAQAGAMDLRRAVYLLSVAALILIVALAGLLLLKLGA